VDLISVACDVRVPPVRIAWLLCKGNNQALVNIVGKIYEFQGRHHDLVGFLCIVSLVPQDVARNGTRFLIYAHQDSREVLISRELPSIDRIVAFVDEPEIDLAALPDHDLICPKVLSESLVLKSEILALLFTDPAEVEVRAGQVVIHDVVHVILPAVVEDGDLGRGVDSVQGDD
jgi:hypothetical protein